MPFHTAFVWQQLAASVQVRPAGEYKLERSIRLRGELVYTTFIDAACANEDHIAWAREQLDRCWNEVGISLLDWAD